MAGRSRLKMGSSGAPAVPGGLQSPWGDAAVGPPSSPGEESNPFSFKEFVRSKNQNSETAAVRGAKSGSSVSPELGAGSSPSPKESSQFTSLLDDNSSSPDSSRLRLDFQEPFFSDPTVTPSLLEDEDDDDWSSSYQPSAIEDALLARTPDTSLSSTFDTFYGNPPDPSVLQSFSPWQLGGTDSLLGPPLGKGDQSSPVAGTAGGEGFCPPLQLSYEELKQENSKLRSKVSHIQAVSETQAERLKQLERTLEENKRKEAKETRDLEAMVQQVEENLQLMTKRAVKAESSAIKLKQENALLQVQLENYRLENEALKAGHLANLAAVKQNADVALQNLLVVLTKSRVSIKQLLSGAEELQIVAELLKSIDKISELQQDSP
ncbi:endosome-associated-trafficking regulator 1 [Sceloporus undulatus]|uniref:endosome-associated-trafficking regulator 1 n=1 Tax=Sceloporus undulatus TaxID=8520 RepID=UPI001C4A7BE2|nr:endosome-associated-trafficking regulator 1 [Sceloporus undulatus]XP_042336454.1 endosome-associated-trafficking regulator 1 [Sceloporus undulatus]